MNYSPKNFIMVVLGLFLFSIGIVLTINAELGVAPWDVFHQGLSRITGITIGQVAIALGVLIVVLDLYLGQAIGWATLLNMVLIGSFMDILMLNNLIPVAESAMEGMAMIFVGLVIQAVGFAIYLSQGMGAGPRDGLMVALTRRTGKSVRFVKSGIELIVVSAGILLGGSFGVGTVIMATMGGLVFQTVFKPLKFDMGKVEHRFIQDDIAARKKGI